MTRTVCSLLTQGHISLDPVTEHMGSQTITPPFPVFTSCCLGTNPSPSRAYLLTWGLLLYCLKQVWLYQIVTMPFRKDSFYRILSQRCVWIDLWERGNNRNLFCFYTPQKIKFKMSQSWRHKIFAAWFKFHLISCIHWELPVAQKQPTILRAMGLRSAVFHVSYSSSQLDHNKSLIYDKGKDVIM